MFHRRYLGYMKVLKVQNHPNSIFTTVIMLAHCPPPPQISASHSHENRK